MRIDKFIAAMTDYSRSDIKRLAKARAVKVDDQYINDTGFKIDPTVNTVSVFGEIIVTFKSRFFMLNKPQGVICATNDSHQKTVIDLLDEPNKTALQVVGRLDKDTTGLVLITDDGLWNHRVTSPNRQSSKHYIVTLSDALDESLIERFSQGLLLNNEAKKTRPARLSFIDSHRAKLSIQEGKYHQIKRMFAACGNHVVALHREAIGDVHLDVNLPAGAYRPLTIHESELFNDR
jgi:16S rRNA pseudouridine516 synthase